MPPSVAEPPAPAGGALRRDVRVVLRVGPRLGWIAMGGAVLLAAFLAAVLLLSGYRDLPAGALRAATSGTAAGDDQNLARELRQARSENRRLQTALRGKQPRGVYIVVDQGNNRLYLRRGDEILLKAVCSAGSGMVLRESEGQRFWIFDTPRGAFRVRTKLRDPVWRKPDWAFVEEGKPIPKDPSERLEYGVLGEYGLYFGDGYLIHGTLYERLLGRSVTHGCIRLGRDDLRQVADAAAIGTPIFIF